MLCHKKTMIISCKIVCLTLVLAVLIFSNMACETMKTYFCFLLGALIYDKLHFLLNLASSNKHILPLL